METNRYIVHDESATRYEIAVMYVDNYKSDYDYQYVVSLVNFGECFFDSDLNFIAQAIMQKTGVFSITDAINIQNGIAKEFEHVQRVKIGSDNNIIFA